ncbi:PTS transporter subunit EIIC [Aeromonas veronii]|uniref:PTS transporter subunit EIIC n=1 Tax=Aeromonas veronii TaxID=654 RepID=UPI001F1DCE93|nr:PTS transporter subunit EIIC [Aeromonas veronii]
MFPVSLMAFMGLLLGVGSSITSPSTIDNFPFLGGEYTQLVFNLMATVGSFGFTYLPIMFAIGIPMGLTEKNKGVAAYSGFVGYMAMNIGINFYLASTNQLASPENIKLAGQAMVMGVQTLSMGVLGGIVSGIVTYFIHRRFYNLKLHDAFSFFSGLRSVPIITVLVMSLIGLAMVRFTPAGGTKLVNGETISGALNIFFAQLKAGDPISPAATAFLSQGFMPTFIFGLPAAALAMYMAATHGNRTRIKSLIISGVLVSIVTGISEPIEFLFLFVAPVLYLFHVFMTGAALFVVAMCGVTIGNTDGSALDLLIFGIMQGWQTKWYLIIPIGLIWSAIYFTVFYWYIKKYDIKTPGRDEVDDIQIAKHDPAVILSALGGKENIVSLDNCVTRLRLVVHDMGKLQEKILKQAGALSVVKIDEHSVQVIIGAQVQTVKDNLDALL